MTIGQILGWVDSLHPNAYTRQEKIRWLSAAEGFLYRAIEPLHQSNRFFEGFTEETSLSTPLLAVEPYHFIYHHYLEAQMCYASGDIEGYNNAMLLYNRLMNQFWRYYHTSHKPMGCSLSVLS